MEKATEENIKCVKINGDFSSMGNHILLPMKVTICGIPVEGAEDKFTSVLGKNKYQELEWNITCKRCIKMINIVKDHHEKKLTNN